MTIGFVLGNGVSRLSVNLSKLASTGLVYGCNALYRDFTPEVLVATDTPIATEIQKSGYSNNHRFYTRRPISGLGAHKIEIKYFGFSSGPVAASIAAKECEAVFLIGFDFGTVSQTDMFHSPQQNRKHKKKSQRNKAQKTNKFNNVYAGTAFYKSPLDPPTFGGNWLKQIITIAIDNPLVQFYRVEGNTSVPVSFCNVKNIEPVQMETFLKILNTL